MTGDRLSALVIYAEMYLSSETIGTTRIGRLGIFHGHIFNYGRCAFCATYVRPVGVCATNLVSARISFYHVPFLRMLPAIIHGSSFMPDQ